ncbi:MAG: hypothetical protein IJU81_00690 [Bacteroidales bacterium]|nr:hypothetical protein [Bacteroidales bacterium]
MNKKIVLGICFLLCLACATPVHKDNDVLNAKEQYEHFLNVYYMGGDVSNIDSALKYNAVLLDSDSVSCVQYFNQIQLLYLCKRYDSAHTFISSIPQDMVSWAPEYKAYLRFKCKAILAKESGDTYSYSNYLDSIIVRWGAVIFDSIKKCDSIFSKPIDSIPMHLWFLYENYYDIVSHVHGKDSVARIFSSKKTKYNWNNETYDLITKSANGDAELTLP